MTICVNIVISLLCPYILSIGKEDSKTKQTKIWTKAFAFEFIRLGKSCMKQYTGIVE